MEVTVIRDNAENAFKILKKRLQNAGYSKYFQNHKHFVSKSKKRTEAKANKLKVIKKYLKIRKKKEGY